MFAATERAEKGEMGSGGRGRLALGSMVIIHRALAAGQRDTGQAQQRQMAGSLFGQMRAKRSPAYKMAVTLGVGSFQARLRGAGFRAGWAVQVPPAGRRVSGCAAVPRARKDAIGSNSGLVEAGRPRECWEKRAGWNSWPGRNGFLTLRSSAGADLLADRYGFRRRRARDCGFVVADWRWRKGV